MTAMPEMVSLFNGMGGACAMLISIVEFNHYLFTAMPPRGETIFFNRSAYHRFSDSDYCGPGNRQHIFCRQYHCLGQIKGVDQGCQFQRSAQSQHGSVIDIIERCPILFIVKTPITSQ
jgi:hypothetical protein